MKTPVALTFLYSAGVALIVAASAKIISGLGSAQVLQVPDPIFMLPFRYLFFGVGVVELVVATVCFFSKEIGLKAGLVACLATNFVMYRLGLLWVGYHKPCHCLGNLTDAIHMSPQMADNVMKCVLAYLLIGSYATLFWLWRQRRQLASGSSEIEVGS